MNVRILVLFFLGARHLLAAAPPPATLIETLDETTCVDEKEVPHRLRLVRYFYGGLPSQPLTAVDSNVIAVEESSRQFCAFRRLWQDYRASYNLSYRSFSGRLGCGVAKGKFLVFLAPTMPDYLEVAVYEGQISTTVARLYPFPEMHERHCIAAELKPRPSAEGMFKMPERTCLPDLESVQFESGRISAVWDKYPHWCPRAALKVDLATETLSGYPKDWSVLPPFTSTSSLCTKEAKQTEGSAEAWVEGPGLQ